MGGNSSVRETREGNIARTGLWCHRVCPVSEDRTGHIRGHSVSVPCPRQDQPHWLCLQKLLVIRVAVRSRSLQQEFAATGHSPSFLPPFPPSIPSQSQAAQKETTGIRKSPRFGDRFPSQALRQRKNKPRGDAKKPARDCSVRAVITHSLPPRAWKSGFSSLICCVPLGICRKRAVCT